jgi:hypothetical protein
MAPLTLFVAFGGVRGRTTAVAVNRGGKSHLFGGQTDKCQPGFP